MFPELYLGYKAGRWLEKLDYCQCMLYLSIVVLQIISIPPGLEANKYIEFCILPLKYAEEIKGEDYPESSIKIE